MLTVLLFQTSSVMKNLIKVQYLKWFSINHTFRWTLNEPSPATITPGWGLLWWWIAGELGICASGAGRTSFQKMLPQCPADPPQGMCWRPRSGPEAWIGLPPCIPNLSILFSRNEIQKTWKLVTRGVELDMHLFWVFQSRSFSLFIFMYTRINWSKAPFLLHTLLNGES